MALLEVMDARLRMYGSATSAIVMADWTRTGTPTDSSCDWSARALMTVASMPM